MLFGFEDDCCRPWPTGPGSFYGYVSAASEYNSRLLSVNWDSWMLSVIS